MISRLEPLNSGRDTEIDMIEREMEGGIVIIQPPDVHGHHIDKRLGDLIGIDKHVEVYELEPKVLEAPKG